MSFLPFNLIFMKYRVTLADGTAQLLQITSDYYKSWKVWKVQFKDGQVAVLLKFGNQWMQRHEDFLDSSSLIAIGKYIDGIIFQKNNLAL
jgi:hypothetical protein